jgi:hypothetical protein
MFTILPIEIILYIKEFISIHDIFGSHCLEQVVNTYFKYSYHKRTNKLMHFPQYYEKINLKNKYKLRWKRYGIYPQFREFYYRNSKDFFKYIIRIQDDYCFHTITIYPQWQNEFTSKQRFILELFFERVFPDTMMNVNQSFVEIIFRQNVPTFTSDSVSKSPRLLFEKLDQTTFEIKQVLDKFKKKDSFTK